MSRAGQPSIYIRLMPLMHALIGASVALFLNTLLCGRPVVQRVARCKPCGEQQGAQTTAAAADLSLRDDARARAVDTASPPADGASEGPPELADGAPPPAPDARAPAAPDGRGVAPAADDTLPVEAVARRLSVAIRPCVGRRVHSFRLGVRVQMDGKVRRVFVAQDDNVSANMIACIKLQLAEFTLPMEIYGGAYVEWRVRHADHQISLTLARPPR